MSPSIALQRAPVWGVGSTSGGRGEMHTQPDHLQLNEFLSLVVEHSESLKKAFHRLRDRGLAENLNLRPCNPDRIDSEGGAID